MIKYNNYIENGELMTKYDKIMVFLVIVFSLSAIAFTKIYIGYVGSKSVYIEIDGKLYKEIFLNDATEETKDIKTKYGRNVVKIEKGTVRVIEADCHDQIDVKQGAISNPGEMLVCLPHKLTIEVKGTKKESDDAVDYISH